MKKKLLLTLFLVVLSLFIFPKLVQATFNSGQSCCFSSDCLPTVSGTTCWYNFFCALNPGCWSGLCGPACCLSNNGDSNKPSCSVSDCAPYCDGQKYCTPTSNSAVCTGSGWACQCSYSCSLVKGQCGVQCFTDADCPITCGVIGGKWAEMYRYCRTTDYTCQTSSYTQCPSNGWCSDPYCYLRYYIYRDYCTYGCTAGLGCVLKSKTPTEIQNCMDLSQSGLYCSNPETLYEYTWPFTCQPSDGSVSCQLDPEGSLNKWTNCNDYNKCCNCTICTEIEPCANCCSPTNPHQYCYCAYKDYLDYGCGSLPRACVIADRLQTAACYDEYLSCHCDINQCGSECDSSHTCSNLTCSQTYNDICSGSQLVDYNNNCQKDSLTKTDSCSRSCDLGTCTCLSCYLNCSASPSTHCCPGPGGTPGVCGAVCVTGQTQACTTTCSYKKCTAPNQCQSVSESVAGTQSCTSNCTYGSCTPISPCSSNQCTVNADCPSCTAGWKCQDATHRGFQNADCSWSSVTYCGDCGYCSAGQCSNYCSEIDTSCGCTTCTDCNQLDGCVGTTYRDYHCVSNLVGCDFDDYPNDPGCGGGNQYPDAAMCCLIVNCKGPGCECDRGNCQGGTWVTYNPVNGVLYTIENNSSDPDGSIASSTWSIVGWQDPFFSCSGICNMTIPLIPAGSYTIKLKVWDDDGDSTETSHSITIKQDVIADFECSLDDPTPGPQTWVSCSDLNPLVGNTVYFKDKSSPSEGEVIISRIWKKDNEPPFSSTNETNPSLTITGTTIGLTVTDSIGRTDFQSYNLSAVLPLPKWKEIKPF